MNRAKNGMIIEVKGKRIEIALSIRHLKKERKKTKL